MVVIRTCFVLQKKNSYNSDGDKPTAQTTINAEAGDKVDQTSWTGTPVEAKWGQGAVMGTRTPAATKPPAENATSTPAATKPPDQSEPLKKQPTDFLTDDACSNCQVSCTLISSI